MNDQDDGKALAAALIERAAKARVPEPLPPGRFESRLDRALTRSRRYRLWPALAGLGVAGVAFAALVGPRLTRTPEPPRQEGAASGTVGRNLPRLISGGATEAPATRAAANPTPGESGSPAGTSPVVTDSHAGRPEARAEGGEPAAPCSPPDDPSVPSVCSATYLGGPNADRAAAIDFARDGTVLLGGVITGELPGATEQTRGEGGPGAIVRLSPDGGRALGVLRLGREVRDLEVDRQTGRVVATGDFGLVVATADLATVLFHHPLPPTGGMRASIGAGGATAVVDGDGNVHTFGPDGAVVAIWTQRDGNVRDIAIHPGTRSVFVAGFTEGQSPGCDVPVPTAFLRAFGYDGGLRWRNYDWSAGHVAVEGDRRRCRHTRANLVVLGRDGKLYMAGESYGGDTPFARDPRDLRRPAPNLAQDPNTDPARTSHRTGIGYLARFAPDTGAIEAGQFLLTRRPDGSGGSLEIEALDVDERGHVLLGGNAACCLPGRDRLTFAGERLEAHGRSEGWMALLPPTWQGRTFWTTWSKTGAAAAKALALVDGRGALAANLYDRNPARTLVIKDALMPERPGGADIYLGVFRVR